MASRTPTKSKNISYISKDFYSVRNDLQEYLKRYFPDTIQDFNEASGGMAILDLMAYVADILSFQMDRTVNENFITRAVERKNILSHAKGFGYVSKSVVPATADITVSATFEKATSAETVFSVNAGTRLTSKFEPANFELIERADFSSDHNREVVFDDGTFVTYSISGVRAMSGRTKTFKYKTPDEPRPFLGITLPDRLVTEVSSVVDNDGVEFAEVDNLSTDAIFIGDSNVQENDDGATHIMKMKKVPNRYVLEREVDGTLTIRFGAGRSAVEDSEILLNPEDFVLPPKLKGYVDGFPSMALDTTNFLKTKSLGNLPKPNSIINIRYRVGGGVATNIGADVLTKSVETLVTYANPDVVNTYPNQISNIEQSITFNNPEAAYGGEDAESNESIRMNAISNMNAQNRCVTLEDYKIRAMSMPPEFGTVFRLSARKDPYKLSGVELITISRNSEGHLAQTDIVLKNNMETYLKKYKGVSDSIRISDAKIVNIGVNFTLYPSAGFNKQQSLVTCIINIMNYLKTENMDIGSVLSISDLLRNLQNLDEVAAIPSLKILNLTGEENSRTYSSYSLSMDNITRNNIVYFPADIVPELKYPNFDIQGTLA